MGSIDVAIGAGAPISDAVYRPNDTPAALTLVGAGAEPPRGIGDNIGSFQDPMTLEQAFPGLATAPSGSIIAATSNLLGLTSPADEMRASINLDTRNALISEIRQYDPNYHHDSFGWPDTLDGQNAEISDLRWDRAAAIYRATGDDRPLQVETYRYLQDQTDFQYGEALAAASVGKLPVAPTERMAIGNALDKAVKESFREVLNSRSLSEPTGGAVRVNGREYDSSGSDLTYSIPDARVGDVAYDVTLWAKRPSTQQIRRFFSSDFSPRSVVIIRPRQLGQQSSYIITKPGR